MTFSKFSLITAILLGISGLVSCSVIESQFADSTLPHTSTPGAECISDGSFGESQQEFRLLELRPGDYKGSSLPHIPTSEAECVSDGS